jgi:twinkle protein
METMLEASRWVDQHFVILNPPDGQRDFDSLLEKAKAYILRRGINGLVIDPWNRVEHHRPEGMTGTEYIGICLDKLSTFSKLYQLHNFIVAHPAKPRVGRDGQYVKGTLYDISDSAHFHNMSDFGLILWRDKENADAPVEINIQKVRSRWCGKLGMAHLFYDMVTGRYSESKTDTGRLPYAEEYEEVQ